MRVAVTGATGTIGRTVVDALLERGDSVVALSRDASSADLGPDVEVHEWSAPKEEAAPAAAFTDVEGVVHLLGEPVAQRWSDDAKREIRDSRVLGTRNLVAGLREAGPRLRVLVSQSATGRYRGRGHEAVEEAEPAADDLLAFGVQDWEGQGPKAEAEVGGRGV